METEVKRALRIAYDTLDTINRKPENTPEYAAYVLDVFKASWEKDPDNDLLKYVSLAMCDWLADIARGGDVPRDGG